jgi:hypothetical protein
MNLISASYVINIPSNAPFDKKDTRWTTFVGEVIRPIVVGLKGYYWFTYYTDFARLRIYAPEAEQQKALSALQAQMGACGCTFRLGGDGKRLEWDYETEKDLGGERFLGKERTDVPAQERALRVIKLLHAGAELFLSTLIQDGAYWREEVCENPNNPYKSSSRSYLHLLHNQAQSDVQVVAFLQAMGFHVLSEYTFSNAVAEGAIQPVDYRHMRLTV